MSGCTCTCKPSGVTVASAGPTGRETQFFSRATDWETRASQGRVWLNVLNGGGQILATYRDWDFVAIGAGENA